MAHRLARAFLALGLFLDVAPAAFAARPAASGSGDPSGVATRLARSTVATYSGSFDPPTRAHLAIIGAALAHPEVDKLHIFVNVTGQKDFRASFGERKAMLLSALGPSAARVEIHPVAQEKKGAQIAGITRGQRVISFIGEDSFDALPVEERARPYRWVVIERAGGTGAPAGEDRGRIERRRLPIPSGISSTAARDELLHAGATPLLSKEVASFIAHRGLYRPPAPTVASLQAALHQEAFAAFQKDLATRFPRLELGAVPPPAFVAGASQRGWAEQFVRWLRRARPDLTRAQLAAAEDILIGRFRGQEYAKLPFVEPVTPTVVRGPAITAVRTTQVPARPVGERYTLDIDAYVQDRLPRALQDELRRGLPVFVHDGPAEEALGYHADAGRTEVHLVHTRRGQPHRMMHLVADPQTGARALVLSEVRSDDRMAHVLTQLGASGALQSVTEVQHARRPPLFRLNATGQALAIGPTDAVVLGFKSGLWRHLSTEPGWTRHDLTDAGLEMSVYEHAASGRRVVSVKAVYGDDMKELVQFLYGRGGRRFTYFGTAGALDPELKVGDVLLPSETRTTRGGWLPIGNLAGKLLGKLAGAPGVHREVKHGWVQTIAQETDRFLERERQAGVQSLDVEVRYFNEALAGHADAHKAVVLFVSDQPLGKTTLEAHNATVHKVDAAFARVVGPLTARERPFRSYLSPRRLAAADLDQLLLASRDPHVQAVYRLARQHGVVIGSWGGVSRALLLGEPVTTDYDFVFTHAAAKHAAFMADLAAYARQAGIKIDPVFHFDLEGTVRDGGQFGFNQGGDLSINRIGVLSTGELLDPLGGLHDFDARTLRYGSLETGFRPGVGSLIRTARFVARMDAFQIDPATKALFADVMKHEYATDAAARRALVTFGQAVAAFHGQPGRASDAQLELEHKAWRHLERSHWKRPSDVLVPAALASTYVAARFRKIGRIPPGANYLDVWKNVGKTLAQAKQQARFVTFTEDIGLADLLREAQLWPTATPAVALAR